MRSGQPESKILHSTKISGICITISQVNRPEASIFHIRVLEFSFFFLYLGENIIMVDITVHCIPVYILKMRELINIVSENCNKSIYATIVAHKLGSCSLIDLRVYIIKFKFTMRHLKEAQSFLEQQTR